MEETCGLVSSSQHAEALSLAKQVLDEGHLANAHA
jgi:hypothetical protein